MLGFCCVIKIYVNFNLWIFQMLNKRNKNGNTCSGQITRLIRRGAGGGRETLIWCGHITIYPLQ